MLLSILINIFNFLTVSSIFVFIISGIITIIVKCCDTDEFVKIFKTTKYLISTSFIFILLSIFINTVGVNPDNQKGSALGTVIDAYTEYGINKLRFKVSEQNFFNAYADDNTFKNLKVGGNYTVEYTSWLLTPFGYPCNKITNIVLEVGK